ncbi:hypothetical protein Tco_1053717 [Tanacetum coccineum]|uniref:Uncharacterized protein n=1 Tax=Tanacetum coccineum TaxID=301880 RepID=A0ABQ5GVE4_9ASTR
MNDHLKAHRDFQQVMDDSMSKLCETFQTWLQQRQEQVVNLDTYTPEPSQYRWELSVFIENLMYDNSFPRPPETLEDDSETVIDSNNDYSSSDDDSPYSEDIDYVDALPRRS